MGKKILKLKISLDRKDCHDIKNILGLAKEKIEYPELKLDNKKATTDREKVK